MTASNNTESNAQDNNVETFIITEFKKSGGIDVVKGFLEQEYSNYSEEVASEVPEITTEDGRKRIKGLAAAVNKKLSELDSPIRDYLRDIKKQPKLIEAIAKDNKNKFTQLRADILKPLEEAQAWQDEDLEMLNSIPITCSQSDITRSRVHEILEHLEGFEMSDVWPELMKKFKVAHEAALTTARVTLERIEKEEAQAAELAELRAKQAAAEQAERDRAIAEAAAKQAKADADAQAQRDREAVDRRAAESKQREENAKAAEAKAIRDAELAEQRRIDDAADAAEQRKQDAIAAEVRQAAAVKLAAENEAKRIAEQEAEQKKLAEARANNPENDKHRVEIRRAAMVDLIAAGIDKDVAKSVILAIHKKEIRNISIQY